MVIFQFVLICFCCSYIFSGCFHVVGFVIQHNIQQQHHHVQQKRFSTTTKEMTSRIGRKVTMILSLSASDSPSSDDDHPSKQQKEQRQYHLPEIFIPNIFQFNDHNNNNNNIMNDNDERLWIPQTDCISFRPLCFSISNGYYVNILRVRGLCGILSKHKHTGPVHGYVMKGYWKYIEHNWIAKPGSYIYEPPGEIHTLIVLPHQDHYDETTSGSSSNSNTNHDDTNNEMMTLFHVTGSLLYCDNDDKVIGYDDVFTKLELTKKHYQKIGLSEDYIQQLIR